MKAWFLLFILISVVVQAAVDIDVAAVLKRTNEIQIESAQNIKAKAKSTQVRDYAQSLIDNSAKNNRDSAALIAKLNTNGSLMNPESVAFIADETNKIQSFSILGNQPQLDKAYIDSQVALNQALISNLEISYIPNAQSADFKDYLEKLKTGFQERLTKAQQIQTSLLNQ